MTINDLAQQLFIKHNSAVGLVDRLAAEGLMVREPSTVDRRKVELKLTPRGRQLLAKLADRHHDELRRLCPVIGKLLSGAGARRGKLEAGIETIRRCSCSGRQARV